MNARFDVIVRGGIVFDGSGSEGVRADVAIIGDKIAEVGNLTQATAAQIIEANGLHVAPGFIDIHTHSDISATYAPDQSSALGMGVTTQVTGNCGLSLGFAQDRAPFEFEKRWLAPHHARIHWNTFAEFLNVVEDRGIATNFIPLAGHGTLRKRVMGMAEQAPDDTEMRAMQAELAGAMEAGAWGLSSGLEYPPSSFADEEELTELCKVVAAHGGLYATHLRDEGDHLVEAVQEALNVAERAKAPLQLSHHKAEGIENWGKVRTTLAMVTQAREYGLDVQMDQYPYPAFMTSLGIQVLPKRILALPTDAMMAALRDSEERARILAEILAVRPQWARTDADSPWRNLQIGVCRGKPDIQGHTILDLARSEGKPPLEWVLDLLLETEGYVSAVNFAIGEDDIAHVMRFPFTSISSDGVGTHPYGVAAKDNVHPRAYGTFPRVLSRYVRELGVLTEAEAIHKMTGLPASRLGLTQRGRIAPNCFADLTLYAPDSIADTATFAAPHQYAQDIAFVLVNGRVAWQDGQPTGTIAGKVLRRN
jgi:N-acyl-D-amino-acid deacylase